MVVYLFCYFRPIEVWCSLIFQTSPPSSVKSWLDYFFNRYLAIYTYDYLPDSIILVAKVAK